MTLMAMSCIGNIRTRYTLAQAWTSSWFRCGHFTGHTDRPPHIRPERKHS